MPADTDEPTTHDAAACLTNADRPICLLQVTAKGGVHFSYRTRPEFADAPEVLRAIGEVDTAMERRLQKEKDPFDQILLQPEVDRRRAVAAALEADRRGAAPEAALAPIRALGAGLRSQSLFFGQIVTASGQQLRAGAYADVCSSVKRTEGSPERASAGLCRAALAGWEAEVRAAGGRFEGEEGVSPAEELARAYAEFGDKAGAERAMRLSPGPRSAIHIRALLIGGRLGEAAEAALRARPAARGGQERDEEQADLNLARMDLRRAAQEAGRGDLAFALAEAELASALAGGGVNINCYQACRQEPALFAVLKHAPADQALQWVERLDAAARDHRSYASLVNAYAAVRAWTQLGRKDRAEALVDHWRRRATAQIGKTCGGERPDFCVGSNFALMLAAVERYDEAFRMKPSFDPAQAVEFDLQTGRGLSRLDGHLAYAERPYERVAALKACAARAGWRRPDLPPVEQSLAQAKTCVGKLFEMSPADRRLISGSTMVNGRMENTYEDAAPKQALELAAAAAGAGDLPLTREMLDRALTTWANSDPQPLQYARFPLETIAMAELRAAGRLRPPAD